LADCDRIFSEKASAASAKGRPELQKALDYVRDEDVFLVTKLDRLARSVVDLAGIVQKLEAKKVDLIVMDQGIDTTTMYGRLQFNILAAIGEFERELIKERSMEGRLKAIARGVKFGAKPKLIKQEISELIRDFEAQELAPGFQLSRPFSSFSASSRLRRRPPASNRARPRR
jgi:DNA invertase Pin-like site-specific DNA recombinase